MSCPRPPTSQVLPYILQQLGHGPLTFFKLYAPSYRCPRCGLEGLFVKVSANDGRTLTEYWDIEGPRDNFENMRDLELHQGIGTDGDFKYELMRPSKVKPHLDIFGTLFVRSSRLIQALVQANLFIDRQAPVGPTSGPQYPPTSRESAKVGASGQRERRRSTVGRIASERLGKRPATICFPTSSVQNPSVRLKLEGVRDDG